MQDTIRRVAADKVAPRANVIDRDGVYPQDMFDLLRELGLFTLPFPPEFGGTGSMLSACVAVEELCRVCYNTAYLLVVQWVPPPIPIGGLRRSLICWRERWSIATHVGTMGCSEQVMSSG